MTKHDLLIEVGTEEIPAQYVAPAAQQLEEKLTRWLDEARIPYETSHWYGTPRRFTAVVHGVNERQEDLNEKLRGPAKRIAVDESGAWTKAALGFARAQGVTPDDLFFGQHKGEDYVFARKKQTGQMTADLLADHLPQLLTSLAFPKSMRWGTHALRFIRPIRWLVALYGSAVIPVSLAGVQSGNTTYGHRFLGGDVPLAHAADYEEALRRDYVIVDPQERENLIRAQLRELEKTHGWHIPVERDLLREVTYLVEYPTAVSGAFDRAFLQLPDDVLITSMREHQRYFPVMTQDGKLLPFFVTVRNGDGTSIEKVAEGNEKVLRARLTDAMFFYNEDQKRSLTFYIEKLEHVVFHEKLGTIGDKVRRIRKVCERLAGLLNLDPNEQAQIDRTAELCKFDLETLMVDEFPELQGRMGEVYAALAGEPPEVASGIREHYLPRHAGDTLPETLTGTIVGLADKIDTIAACFGIGIVPTGSEDPYALRRQAAGIVHVLLQLDVGIALDHLCRAALDELQAYHLLNRPRVDIEDELERFFAQRLKHVLEERGVRHDVIDAVLKSDVSAPKQVIAKADLLMKQVADPTFKRTVEALTRVENLAAQAGGEAFAVDEGLLEEKAETALLEAYHGARKQCEHAEQNGDVQGMYSAIASMEAAIHAYFDDVMVMVDDPHVRCNRLAVLQAVSQLAKRFAHFGELVFP